jgi:hypothetical protein
MNRPLTRPEKPYTIREYLDMVYQHFVVDQSPKCVADPTDLASTCLYTGTGCMIGFILTEKDSEEVYGDIITMADRPLLYRIMSYYFDLTNPAVLAFLEMCQMTHDSYVPGGSCLSFARYMQGSLMLLSRIAKQLNILD